MCTYCVLRIHFTHFRSEVITAQLQTRNHVKDPDWSISVSCSVQCSLLDFVISPLLRPEYCGPSTTIWELELEKQRRRLQHVQAQKEQSAASASLGLRGVPVCGQHDPPHVCLGGERGDPGRTPDLSSRVLQVSAVSRSVFSGEGWLWYIHMLFGVVRLTLGLSSVLTITLCTSGFGS